MAEFFYNIYKEKLWHGATTEIDIINDEICILALMVDDEDTDELNVDTLLAGTADEVDSTGYVGSFEGADRLTLTTPVITVDQASDRAEFDCDDLTWSAISQNAAEEWVAFIVFNELTNDAGSILIAHLEPAGVPLTPNGSDIKITIDGEGLLHIT